MKYLLQIVGLVFFVSIGCLGSSYIDISPGDLASNPEMFEGKKVCINGIFENNTISGILILKTRNFTGEFRDWTLSKVCGTYGDGKFEADSADSILSIFSTKDVYHSNETQKVRIDFHSKEDGIGHIHISGIKNAFGGALISETKDVSFKKGKNSFDFEFKTPSCEECSALSPGEYYINSTIDINGNIFETYKKITLEREK